MAAGQRDTQLADSLARRPRMGVNAVTACPAQCSSERSSSAASGRKKALSKTLPVGARLANFEEQKTQARRPTVDASPPSTTSPVPARAFATADSGNARDTERLEVRAIVRSILEASPSSGSMSFAAADGGTASRSCGAL